MGIVRFALKFPYTFYVVAALILFLGLTAITACRRRRESAFRRRELAFRLGQRPTDRG